jgi:hypothetical protein
MQVRALPPLPTHMDIAMSLPSRAIIRNQQGEILANPFINCGWYDTPDSVARVLMHEIKDEGYVDTDTIEAYSIVVPVKLLRSVKDRKELSQALEPLFEKRDRQWRERNAAN